MKNQNCIIYIGETVNQGDVEAAVSIGTCYEWRLPCREFEKHMRALWIFQLDASKSKGGWDYWENNNLTPWLEANLKRTRVVHDREHMKALGVYPSCRGRTNSWWLLETPEGDELSLDDLIELIQEKIKRG